MAIGACTTSAALLSGAVGSMFGMDSLAWFSAAAVSVPVEEAVGGTSGASDGCGASEDCAVVLDVGVAGAVAGIAGVAGSVCQRPCCQAKKAADRVATMIRIVCRRPPFRWGSGARIVSVGLSTEVECDRCSRSRSIWLIKLIRAHDGIDKHRRRRRMPATSETTRCACRNARDVRGWRRYHVPPSQRAAIAPG